MNREELSRSQMIRRSKLVQNKRPIWGYDIEWQVARKSPREKFKFLITLFISNLSPPPFFLEPHKTDLHGNRSRVNMEILCSHLRRPVSVLQSIYNCISMCRDCQMSTVDASRIHQSWKFHHHFDMKNIFFELFCNNFAEIEWKFTSLTPESCAIEVWRTNKMFLAGNICIFFLQKFLIAWNEIRKCCILMSIAGGQ